MSATATTGGENSGARAMALASALVVVATFLTVFYHLTSLFGGTAWLAGYVLLALVVATVVAGRVPARAGFLAGGALVVVGLAGYLLLLPSAYYRLFTPGRVVEDLVGWLTGKSVVLMLEADLWAVSVAPGAVFLTWYLALRGRYDGAALAGGGTLSFFVLTGDLGGEATLLGMAGVLGVLGFGAVATSDGGYRQLQEIGLVVGLGMLLTRFVQVVPAAGVADRPRDRGTGDRTLERTLLGDRDRIRVGGTVSLSPEPRFTVDADAPAYWHARSFDRYTGRGWRRTAAGDDAGRPLRSPPGDATTVNQTFTVESGVGAMPGAWKPVLLGRGAKRAGEVTPVGDLSARAPLQAGSSYKLISQVPEWTEQDLRTAGEGYPRAVAAAYTQLPDDLPDRLVEKADEIAADAGTPYETALAIQAWLQENKDYSLSVSRREWDVADAFVFAMDAGYCVYFATTMAVLLRTQGVPARFVTGYAPGEPVAEKRWRLRGLHSHAWVEAYFPGTGWVTFDPTPASGRQQAREERLEEAAAAGPSGGSAGEAGTPTPTPSPTPTAGGRTDGPNATTGTAAEPDQAAELLSGPDNVSNATATSTEGVPGAVQGEGGGTATATPTPRRGRGTDGDRLWMLGALATVAFGSVRLGVAQSAVKRVWLRYQPQTGPPADDVERALERLEYHYGRQGRERREGETHQQYLEAVDARRGVVVDQRAWRVLALYHRSRYGDGVARSEATEAIRLVDELVR